MLYLLLLLISSILVFISGNKKGDFSFSQRKLARGSLILISQFFSLSFLRLKYLPDTTSRCLFLFFNIFAIVIYLLENYRDIHSKGYIVLICEFSDAASQEIPKDRHITYYVREEIKNEFQKSPISIIDVDKVIIDENNAYKIGLNAGATAVIYGIITKVQKNIKLDLRFLVIRKPQFYQPIDTKKRILPIEELDSGQLESYVGQDYTIAIDFLFGLFEYSSNNFVGSIQKFLKALNGISNQNNYGYSVKVDIISLYLGNAYYLSGDNQSAINAYNYALKQSEQLPKIIHNLGIIEFQSSNLDKSIELFSRAISLDANLMVAYRNRGFALIQKEKYEEALSDLLTYINQKPFDSDALELIGLCYSHLNSPRDAIKNLMQSYRISKNRFLFFDIANEHFAQKNYFLCFLLLSLNAFKPKFSSQSFGIIADCLTKLEKTKLAEIFYSLAIKLDKDNFHLYFSRSYVRTLRKNTSGAKEDLKKVIQIEPRMADAHYNLGNLYYLDKEQNLAVEHYSKCLELLPHSLDALFNRAKSYCLLEQYDLSIADAKKYLELDVDNTFNEEIEAIIKFSLMKQGKLKK